MHSKAHESAICNENYQERYSQAPNDAKINDLGVGSAGIARPPQYCEGVRFT